MNVFDFETKNDESQEKGWTRPFLIGFYDDDSTSVVDATFSARAAELRGRMQREPKLKDGPSPEEERAALVVEDGDEEQRPFDVERDCETDEQGFDDGCYWGSDD